jgi:hypothetical protein
VSVGIVNAGELTEAARGSAAATCCACRSGESGNSPGGADAGVGGCGRGYGRIVAAVPVADALADMTERSSACLP